MNQHPIHTFHIPVMGTAFSIDTPVKVARYGIHSVLSLVDDTLIEHMRKFYCEKEGEPYTAITKYDEDFRAKRITAYLNLIDRIIERQFKEVKSSHFEPGSEITKYFEMIDDANPLKAKYKKMLAVRNPLMKLKLQEELRSEMRPGEIHVNIMTKLDRDNFDTKGNKLAPEFSDALAALRGYGQSTLRSAIVFSAGINRRLYSYVEQFQDFYADATGDIKKKIILKVSDFRSSFIQGKFFAQKGLWISEYRIESGLNCGGHAFASDGYLMGPILEEFRTKREELISQLHASYNKALASKNRKTFDTPHSVKITAQGGIGTRQEDEFLRKHYKLEGTGWGTPFLLCPEATNVDDMTLRKLAQAGEADLYLSDVSPLGVPFNNLRGSLSDTEKEARVFRSKAGSACPKGHLVSNTEFTKEPICTASRQYQKLKIDQLNNTPGLDPEEHKIRFDRIVAKACICHDLGESALLTNQIQTRVPGFPAVCPGPNLAYFSKIVTLKEMVDHIYGRTNILNSTPRPHMFIKELRMYVDYLRKEVEKSTDVLEQKAKYFTEFKNNMLEGIDYYLGLYPQMSDQTEEFRDNALREVEECRQKLLRITTDYSKAFIPASSAA